MSLILTEPPVTMTDASERRVQDATHTLEGASVHPGTRARKRCSHRRCSLLLWHKTCNSGIMALSRAHAWEPLKNHDALFHEADAMTEPLERPQHVPSDMPQRTSEGEPLLVPVDAQMAVQQLREAGFSADQQAALTTALLRVLALWTQQATRGDLQTELHAGEQRLVQQLNALREEIRHEVAQHTNALREELQSESARHADLLHTTRAQPTRKSDVVLWLITALLVLTCAGVFLLVGRSVLGW